LLVDADAAFVAAAAFVDDAANLSMSVAVCFAPVPLAVVLILISTFFAAMA
jgi:hypothetical protein